MNNQETYRVGEPLKCMKYVERRDRESCIFPGQIVKVLQAYSFTYEGKLCQDLTVQYGHKAPIAVLAEPGRFARLTP